MIISRFIEFYIFNFVYLILLEKNISWLITISVSFLFKFLYLELLSFLKKELIFCNKKINYLIIIFL